MMFFVEKKGAGLKKILSISFVSSSRDHTTVHTFAKNVEELRQRGLHLLVTTTPRYEGRSFGTNVMEAMLPALMDKPQKDVTPQDFIDLIDRIPQRPAIEVLD